MPTGWRTRQKGSFFLHKETYNYQKALHILPSKVKATAFQPQLELIIIRNIWTTMYKNKCFGWHLQFSFTILKCVSCTPMNFSFCKWTIHASTSGHSSSGSSPLNYTRCMCVASPLQYSRELIGFNTYFKRVLTPAVCVGSSVPSELRWWGFLNRFYFCQKPEQNSAVLHRTVCTSWEAKHLYNLSYFTVLHNNSS